MAQETQPGPGDAGWSNRRAVRSPSGPAGGSSAVTAPAAGSPKTAVQPDPQEVKAPPPQKAKARAPKAAKAPKAPRAKKR